MSADTEHEEAVGRFVEQFAMLMNDAGLPRMPARVFSYVLASDAQTHTATELARGLRVSPAAISGAVRLLVNIGMLVKEREPGEPVDRYRVYDKDVWATIIGRQLPVFERYDRVFTDGLQSLPADRRGAQRIRETRDFYRFLRAEMDQIHMRWQQRHVTSAPEPVRLPAG